MNMEMKIELRQTSSSASEASIGRHRVTIDRPEAKGGSDAGPMGGQLFLAAVGGCFMSTLLAAIKAREAENATDHIANVHVEAVGTLADSPPRFTAIELRVSADAHNPELLAHLIEIADRGCIMMNTLRTTLQLRISLLAPA